MRASAAHIIVISHMPEEDAAKRANQPARCSQRCKNRRPTLVHCCWLGRILRASRLRREIGRICGPGLLSFVGQARQRPHLAPLQQAGRFGSTVGI